jgi:hypothetical protein
MMRHGATWLLVLALSVLVGCAMHQAYNQLPPEEQARFRAYSRLMSSSQSRTYLNLASAAERAAFAQQLGVSDELDSLSEADRTAVLQGQPFQGMSAQALRLLWGMPCWEWGPEAFQRWFYYGHAVTLARLGWHCRGDSTITEVALENNQVRWWRSQLTERSRAPFGRPR